MSYGVRVYYLKLTYNELRLYLAQGYGNSASAAGRFAADQPDLPPGVPPDVDPQIWQW